MFLNYDVNIGLSINTFRRPSAWSGDIGDLAIAYQNENECVVCDLAAAKEALESMDYFSGTDVSDETIEKLHDFITENE